MSDDDIKRLGQWTKGKGEKEKAPSDKPRPSRDAGKKGPPRADEHDDLLHEFMQAGPLEEHERAHRAPAPAFKVQSTGRPTRRIPQKTPGATLQAVGNDLRPAAGAPGRGAAPVRQASKPPQKPGFPDNWFQIPSTLPGVAPSRSSAWDNLLRHPEAQGPETTFRVGIDVGTSGIRIASYDEETGRIRIFDFGNNEAGGTRFSFPAVVGLDSSGTSLLVGNDAVSVPHKSQHTSFKAGLIYPEHPSRDRKLWGELGEAARRLFEGASGPGPEAFCYTVSLARAMELAIPTVLVSSDENPPEVFVSLGVGAPGRRESACHRRIEHATFAALRMAGAIGSSPSLEATVQSFIWAWREAEADLAMGPEEKRVDVVPEVYASVRALQDGFANGENLLVADIGATTTEMAVLRYNANCIHRWVGDSHSVGVDHREGAQLEFRDLIGARRERAVKSASHPTGAWSGLDDVCADLSAAAKRTLLKGIELNVDQPSWAELSVFVVGGGSNIPPLRDAVAWKWKTTRSTDRLTWVQRVGLRSVAAQNAEAVGTSDEPPNAREISEIVTVLGITRPLWTAEEFSDEPLEPVKVINEDPLIEMKSQQLRDRGWT